MSTTLWLLLLEDVLLLILIGTFLYLRQRPYPILAVVIFTLALLMNIATLNGFSNAIAFGFTSFCTVAILYFLRPFLPQPRITMGVRASRIVLVISFFIVLVLTVLLITAIFFGRRK